jgi:hypothetical protein
MKRKKLSADMVDAIRKRIAAGEKLTGIAAEFGVSTVTVSQIKTGKRHHERERS